MELSFSYERGTPVVNHMLTRNSARCFKEEGTGMEGCTAQPHCAFRCGLVGVGLPVPPCAFSPSFFFPQLHEATRASTRTVEDASP